MDTRLGILFIIILLVSFVTTAQPKRAIKTGSDIFSVNCVRCHGTDGTRRKWGAKDLQKSNVTDEKLITIITNGNGFMPAWKKSLTKQEIETVKDYVKTLRR